MLNLDPYKINGRWYKIFLESSGSAHKITTSDIKDAYVSGNYVMLPAGTHIVDFKMDIHNVTSNAGNVGLNYHLLANGQLGVTIPTPAQYDYMDLYVFAYKKE